MTAPVIRMFPNRNPPAKVEPTPVVEEVKAEEPVKETVVAKVKKKVAPKE